MRHHDLKVLNIKDFIKTLDKIYQNFLKNNKET